MVVYYKNIIEVFERQITNIIRVGEDNVAWTLGAGEQDPGYLAWVAEGNEAQTWE